MSLAHSSTAIGLNGTSLIPVDYQDILFTYHQTPVSGRGHKPVLQSNANFTHDDKFHASLELTSTSVLSYTKDLLNLAAFTINAWINTTVTTGTIVEVINVSNPAANRRVWFYILNGKLGIHSGNALVTTAFTGLVDIPTGVWTMVTVTFDGSTFRLYVNGSLDFSLAGVAPVLESTATTNVGGRYFTGFQGSMAQLVFLPRAANSSEVYAWNEYASPFYDPYNYQVSWGG